MVHGLITSLVWLIQLFFHGALALISFFSRGGFFKCLVLISRTKDNINRMGPTNYKILVHYGNVSSFIEIILLD